tara:strand:+ start:1470 stop:1625 length:156 start_codon:yes stop_codon:yes gene_type:complete
MKAPNKQMVAYRFGPKTVKALKRFAKKKNVTQTAVLEALIDRYCCPAKAKK